MKRLITKHNLLLFLCLIGSLVSAQAQIVIAPSPIEVNVHPAAFEGIAHSFVTNNGASDEFVWERNVISITEGWRSAVCDVEMCHNDQVSSMEFPLESGESGVLDVHVYPYGFVGSAIIEVVVTSLSNPDITATGVYYFNQSVSVPERLSEAIKLYPNPAIDQIFIGEGENVDRIELFSLSGRKVLDAPLNNERVVSVGHLSTGTYIARLFNASGEQVSSNLMIKK